jgi:hypothetical protein
MEVTKIIVSARSPNGAVKAGWATFDDGKEWAFNAADNPGNEFFTIESGIHSQWSYGDWARTISPPKRVAALRKALDNPDTKKGGNDGE